VRKILNRFYINKMELIIGFLAFLLIFLLSFYSRLLRITDGDAIKTSEAVELILLEDISLTELLNHNQVKAIIDNPAEVKWVAGMLGWKNFKSGRYLFEGNYGYEVFLSKLARGVQDPVSLTIIPGSTITSVAEKAAGLLNFETEQFISVFEDSAFFQETGLTKEKLFGRMYPETYKVYWSTKPKVLLRRILREFDRNVTQQHAPRADSLGLTIDELLTLASIIEWEANNDEEKPRISGLYWNRLNKNIPLQADPTVNYALGERRRLLFEDYKIDHPYNTYLYTGLPPGPVTNPGLSSILAALYPEDHNYLYMVANPQGGHTFTRTFEEHQQASEKWRKWIREQYRIKRNREAEENSL